MCRKIFLLPFLAFSITAHSQEQVDRTPELHGTIRGKYEYQTGEQEGRFQVRNARVSVSGKVIKEVEYKAEIDLCDEGDIKMLDAYTRVSPWRSLRLTIGQMRVPFTIDAHRSPDRQYFANRSFIAKQVGNIRDVGAMAGYDFMTDHSDGTRSVVKSRSGEERKALVTNDYQRHRLTAGLTLSLSKPFRTDIRLNYEKYFYRDDGIPKTSEKDKLVIEVMTHF